MLYQVHCRHVYYSPGFLKEFTHIVVCKSGRCKITNTLGQMSKPIFSEAWAVLESKMVALEVAHRYISIHTSLGGFTLPVTVSRKPAWEIRPRGVISCVYAGVYAGTRYIQNRYKGRYALFRRRCVFLVRCTHGRGLENGEEQHLTFAAASPTTAVQACTSCVTVKTRSGGLVATS